MADSARAMMGAQVGHRDDARLKGFKGSYRFDVQDVGSWCVRVDNGAVDVTESRDAADCVIACDEQDFVRIARGQQNLLTAVLQGRVSVQGDYALAQRLHGFVRGREAAA